MTATLKIDRYRRQAQFFPEPLGEGIALEMVEIPAGRFQMGSPDGESKRQDREGPQHWVTVPRFFMGKYPVTQAQWRALTAMAKADRDLHDLEPDPSNFKGDDLPVEQVNWYDAMEFCARLSAATGRTYTLPSEAQWEYACRAGTETPFHFGETITTELANYRGTDRKEYNWSGSYGRGPKGEYREKTTAVGQFPANDFGLYDLHGNLWEWCLDDYHDSYEGAPVDGSAWLNSEERNSRKVLRGGSWIRSPEGCRSAYRGNLDPDLRYSRTRFRVVCLPQDS
ncbi:MAG: formylglycine-generating enzyme family protein [Cyanobacteria bacterium J06629_9]